MQLPLTSEHLFKLNLEISSRRFAILKETLSYAVMKNILLKITKEGIREWSTNKERDLLSSLPEVLAVAIEFLWRACF